MYTLVKEMQNKKYHTVGTIAKSKIKIVERGILDIYSTHIHERVLSWLGTRNFNKNWWIKLDLLKLNHRRIVLTADYQVISTKNTKKKNNKETRRL